VFGNVVKHGLSRLFKDKLLDRERDNLTQKNLSLLTVKLSIDEQKHKHRKKEKERSRLLGELRHRFNVFKVTVTKLKQ